ncbi:hypothetical protein FK535_10890 [Mycolicibacterium sp. 018/SC-01/001]|nr:hypothetical protein FK535_10890 [Mycolicibacterium sp. 018/SC-01/001]
MPVMPVRMPDLAALGAAAGLLALTGLPGAVRAVALVAFIAIGPGAAILTWVRIPRRAVLSTVPVLGMAVATLVAIVAMWSYRWDPIAILWLQVVAVAGSSAYWYYQNRSTVLDATRRWRIRRIRVVASPHRRFVRNHLSLLLSGLAVAIWTAAIPGLPGVDAGYYGLLFSGTGPALAVSIVLCAAALLVAIRDRRLLPAAVAVAAAIVVLRVTTVVATEVPLYDWTYKHLAVVDYIVANGRIAPDGTDIYAQWAAFFTTWAWFCDVTGISAMTVAHLFAPAVHVLIALTVYTTARVLGRSRRTALTAAFVAEIANWVGQDYFSPQAWALVLTFGMLALLLGSRQSRASGVLAVLVFAATVPTHQLTPFWAVGVAFLLCVFKRARPWWSALAMAVIAGSYLLLNFEAVAPYGLFQGGSPLSNATTSVVISGLPAQEFTSTVVSGLSAAVALTAAATAAWMWWRKRPVFALAIVSFSSFGLLLGQSYGGEAIFRVYLYSLLGCSILIASAVVGAIDAAAGRARWVSRAAAVAWVTLASLAGLHGYVALWPMVYETKEQVDLMTRLTADGDIGSRFMMLRLGGMPTRVSAEYAGVTLYNPYYDDPIEYELENSGAGDPAELKARYPTDSDLRDLIDVVPTENRVSYMIFSEQSNKAMRYYGDFRPEAVDRVQDALRASPNWTQIYDQGQTKVWRSVNNEWLPKNPDE